MDNFDYYMKVQEYFPPIADRYRYYAIISAHQELCSSVGKNIPLGIFGEQKGETEEEAKKHMNEAINKWIEEN